MDDEFNEINLIRDGFVQDIKDKEWDPDGISPYFFANGFAATIYREATGAHLLKDKALSALRNLLKDNSIKELQVCQHGRYKRGFLWVSDNAVSGSEYIKVVTPKQKDVGDLYEKRQN